MIQPHPSPPHTHLRQGWGRGGVGPPALPGGGAGRHGVAGAGARGARRGDGGAGGRGRGGRLAGRRALGQGRQGGEGSHCRHRVGRGQATVCRERRAPAAESTSGAECRAPLVACGSPSPCPTPGVVDPDLPRGAGDRPREWGGRGPRKRCSTQKQNDHFPFWHLYYTHAHTLQFIFIGTERRGRLILIKDSRGL